MLADPPPGAALSDEATATILADVGSAAALRPRLDKTVAAAVARFRRDHSATYGSQGRDISGSGATEKGGAAVMDGGVGATDDHNPEMKVTVLVSWAGEGNATEVSAHVALLPPPPSRSVPPITSKRCSCHWCDKCKASTYIVAQHSRAHRHSRVLKCT
jgi:hypothetical protein